MTDERLSQAIAEFLEPEPRWVKTGTGGDESIVSMLGAWTIPERCITPLGTSDKCVKHRPKDMVNDPAMTVMLLEKLVVLRGFVSLSAWVSSPTRVCVTGQIFDGEWKSDEPSTYAAEDTLGRAVALAFARANGLKVEE